MALASEVIDLISDSEDDTSPTKAAVSTLQAFVPRKEKTTPANQSKSNATVASTPQRTPYANIAPKPLANIAPRPNVNIAPRPQADIAPTPHVPVATPNTTNHWPHVPPNASISEILSQSLQNVARQAGLIQPQQSPVVTTPGRQNGISPQGAGQQRQQHAPPISLEHQRTNFIQYKPTRAEPTEARDGGSVNGRPSEERRRRFVEYHKKEAERKSGGPTSQHTEPTVDTNAGAVVPPNDGASTVAQTTSSSLVQPTVDYEGPSWQRQSPQHHEPQAKRRKHTHQDEADDEVGMAEARRLSAAAIHRENDSASHNQAPTETKPREPNTSQSPSSIEKANARLSPHKVTEQNEQAPAAATEHSKMGEKRRAEDTFAGRSATPPLPPTVQEIGSIKTQPILLEESSDSDSPDEIPAKPMRKRPPLEKPDVLPRTRAGQAIAPTTSAKSQGPTFESIIKPQAIEKAVPKSLVPTGNGELAVQQFGNHGVPYTAEEDKLLAYLKEEARIGWDEIMEHFSGRTRGSLQVRYSSKVKHRKREPANPQPLDVHVSRPEAEAPATFATSATLKPQSSGVQKRQFTRLEAEAPSEIRKSATSRTLSLGVKGTPSSRLEAEAPAEYVAPSRRNLKVAPRTDGFVSWAEIKALRKEENAAGKSATPIPAPEASLQTPGLGLDVAHPASISRILRSRELGNTARRNWSSNSRLGVSDELQNHILDTLGPMRYFHGASRDVTCVAWAGDGNQFAAGAIAIDDERSMQYNRPNNLLLGDVERNSLQELPEHHVARPTVSDSRNANSLRAMQETQDARLFKTVAAVGFSDDSRKLYSAGSDGVVRMYDTSSGSCLSSVKQEAEVALLTMNSKGLLASGSHRPDDGSISVLRSYDDQLEAVCQLGPSRADAESSLPIYPSALKWGAGIYSHLLLAGFASDSYDDDRLAAGEIFLWDSTVGQKIGLPTARNVFDVAWNPFPSSGASLFAVAGARHGRRYRSTIQCFAPNQGRASRVLEWDCPAFDINDLVYCPHDDNLIAAGATDGKVYIWDKRAANRSQAPLHILSHDQTKNVLDHDRDLEIADTGVRFLSWSATGNRLYSGSSDGVVKVWNPYRATQDAHVKDVASFNSAVMSGAFSPDYRDLLIGEDASQLNLLGIDREDRKARAAKKFEYFPAPAPVVEEDKFATARELLATEQLEVRPMGNLPIKQVVQGRKYKGPFLAPSDDFVSDLDAQHQLALRKQRELRTRLPGGQLDQKTKDAVELVDRQVLMFQQALQVARQKWEDHKTLEPAALLLQKTFRDTEELAVHLNKSCSLDCNYLPAAGDEDGEAPDNRRSEQRIPGKLRLQHQFQDTADMTNAEIEDAGLTGKCSACMGPAAKSKRGLAICEKCSLVRSGLTARCEKCAAPVRPNLDERVKQNICERCNFHCFRCGGIATVSPTCDTITCEPCDTQWEAGALGYEVKGAHSPSRRMRDWNHEQDMESLDQRMGRLFGEDEMERLAGRFHA